MADHYVQTPRVYQSKQAPEIARASYDEILGLLRSMPWDRIAHRNVSQTRKCAPRESFAMGGVLGNPCFHGFREGRVGRMGYNDKIAPTVLAKQTEDVMRLWRSGY